MTDDTKKQLEEANKARQESAKLFYDLFKHVTTLATGTLVILATFLEKLFKQRLWQPLVIVIFVCLIISLLCALINMFFMAKHVRESVAGKAGKFSVLTFLCCLASFLIAMLCLTVFTVRNFMTDGASSITTVPEAKVLVPPQ